MNGWTVLQPRSVGNSTRLTDRETIKDNLLANRNPANGDYTLLPFDVDGSAASPVIKRASSADGIFFEAGKVGFSIAGIEVAYVNADGFNGGPGKTYTPVLSAGSGIDTASSTAKVFKYTRVGNIVTVSGGINLVITATGNLTWKMTLPVDLLTTPIGVDPGFGIVRSSTIVGGVVIGGVVSIGSTTDATGHIYVPPTTTGNKFVHLLFQYEVA